MQRLSPGLTLLIEYPYMLHQGAIGHWGGDVFFPMYSMLKSFGFPKIERVLLLCAEERAMIPWVMTIMTVALGLKSQAELPRIYLQSRPVSIETGYCTRLPAAGAVNDAQSQTHRRYGHKNIISKQMHCVSKVSLSVVLPLNLNVRGLTALILQGINIPLAEDSPDEWRCYERVLSFRDTFTGADRGFYATEDGQEFRNRMYALSGLQVPVAPIAPSRGNLSILYHKAPPRPLSSSRQVCVFFWYLAWNCHFVLTFSILPGHFKR